MIWAIGRPEPALQGALDQGTDRIEDFPDHQQSDLQLSTAQHVVGVEPFGPGSMAQPLRPVRNCVASVLAAVASSGNPQDDMMHRRRYSPIKSCELHGKLRARQRIACSDLVHSCGGASVNPEWRSLIYPDLFT